MAIKMVLENNEFRPYTFCDWCGKRIIDARDGNYEWKMEQGEIINGNIFFTHKKCCRDFENEHGGRLTWCCDELELLPFYVKNNLRINKRHANQTVRIRNLFG